ncbi:MAG: hypothetical protein AAFQ43_13320 [Bacteroidota bacterium]
MHALRSAAARLGWAAAFLFALLPLAACGSDGGDDRQRPAVSFTAVEELRTEAAIRFVTTDDALAELEGAVAALDSTEQASAMPRLTSLRSTRATLQARLDSLDATAFASPEAFAEQATDLRGQIDALDAALARDRVLIVPDAARLRSFATERLTRVQALADALRADSTASGVRAAADLDSARVRLERTLALVGRGTAPYDSLRDVLAAGFADLRGLQRDSLADRLRPDSLR